jgi:hypothetical protein
MIDFFELKITFQNKPKRKRRPNRKRQKLSNWGEGIEIFFKQFNLLLNFDVIP